MVMYGFKNATYITYSKRSQQQNDITAIEGIYNYLDPFSDLIDHISYSKCLAVGIIHLGPLLDVVFRRHIRRLTVDYEWMKSITKSKVSENICIAQSTLSVKLSISI